jgi:hypothetical protein
MSDIFKHIPAFVEAPTREGLVKRMLEVAAKDGNLYRFFDISFDPKMEVWVSWYYPDRDD